MSNILTSNTRTCQVVTTNGFNTGYTFLYHLSPKNRIDDTWFLLPPSVIIFSGVIMTDKELRFLQGHFNNRYMPDIKQTNQDNIYKVRNFSGNLTNIAFYIKAGSVLRINLSQFGLTSFYKFAQFTL